MLNRLCAALIAVTGITMSPAFAGIFDGAPDAITCEFPATGNRPAGQLVFYVDVRALDGRLLYKSLGALKLHLIVSADGRIEDGNIAGCNGKTLQELRASGRAFDFH